MILVVVCFLLGGLVQLVWPPVAAVYTRIVATVSTRVVWWLEPVPVLDHLITRGTQVRPQSVLLPTQRFKPLETSSFWFYLPFVLLLLVTAGALYRLASVTEILSLVLFLFAVHVTCLSLGVLWSESQALSQEGARFISRREFAVLQALARLYFVYGIQLWSGLMVAFVLLRSAAGTRVLAHGFLRALSSPGGLAACCVAFLLPSLAFMIGAPAIRHLSGAANDARLAVALREAARGALREAEELAGAVLAEDATDVRALELMARLADRPEEAESWYRRLLAVQPDRVGAHYDLGGLLARRGAWQAAAGEYRSVLEFSPGHVDARYQLGNCYLRQGEIDAARREYDRVLELDAARPDALGKRAYINHLQGDDCAARNLYARALSLEPVPEDASLLRRQLQEAEAGCRQRGKDGT